MAVSDYAWRGLGHGLRTHALHKPGTVGQPGVALCGERGEISDAEHSPACVRCTHMARERSGT